MINRLKVEMYPIACTQKNKIKTEMHLQANKIIW